MTRTDRIVIIVLAVLTLAVWPLVASAQSAGGLVEIAGPTGTTRVELSNDAVLQVQGTNGPLTVVVEGGEVFVAEAQCPDHICEKAGAISAGGSVVACVPNGVVIRVDRGEGDELDARIR